MKYIFVLIMIFAIKSIYELFAHELIFNSNKKINSIVLQQGLIHYTTLENASRILETQTILGTIDNRSILAEGREKKIAWFLLNYNTFIYNLFRKKVISRHCPVNPTGINKLVRYETKLLITGLDYKNIKKMKRNLEMSIGIYCDKLENVYIQPAPIDKIDRKLGIRKFT